MRGSASSKPPASKAVLNRIRAGNLHFQERIRRKYGGSGAERQAKGQSPRVAAVYCSDSWVPLEKITGLGHNSIFTYSRNAGNIVNPKEASFHASAAYHLLHLPPASVIGVVGHYDCGGVKGLDALERLEAPIRRHLRLALPARAFVDEALKKAKATVLPDERHRLIVEANVLLQLHRLGSVPEVKHAVEKGARVQPFVYDMFSGVLHVGVPALEKRGWVDAAKAYFKKAVR